MSQFKKTLQDGTPEALSRRPDGTAGTNVLPPPQSLPAPRRARAKTTAAPLSHLYDPPQPTHDEVELARPAPATRITEASETPGPGAALPEGAPGWMVRARGMSLALEAAIAAGQLDTAHQASIERAWAAWELDGNSDKNVARVATLVDRARTAIRDTGDDQLERAFNDCAQVLWASLPREIKVRQDMDEVLLVMRGLRDEADPWEAIIDATARILGWTQAARAHAALAIRAAISAERSS